MSIYINSLAYSVPNKVITNFDLEKMMDTSDEWIRSRTGIEKRHILTAEENSIDYAIDAAKKALALSKTNANELTHIFVATCTPQMLTPSMACMVAGALEIIESKKVFALDINAACSGFLYGLDLIDAVVRQCKNAKVLFITSEALSRRLNYQDRTTAVLFGDGSAAVVISNNKEDKAQEEACQFRLIDTQCYTDGTLQDLIRIGGGTAILSQVGDSIDEEFFLQMQGREVYKHAIRSMSNACKEVLSRNNLSLSDIRFVVPHQANKRIIDSIFDSLEVSEEARYINVQRFGNTSASSIPIALSEILDTKVLKTGDKLLLTTFGAGLTWAASIIEAI